MKLVCEGLELSEAVQKVSKAVSVKNANSILEGIKLKASGKTLTLTATDLELTIEKKILADIKIEGEAVVPGRFFAEFIKKLNNQLIELTLISENQLKIRFGDSEGVVQTLPSQDYPKIKDVIEGEYFSIVRKEFKDLISKVSFSVSQDDSLPIFKGVFLEIDDYKLTGVALDGFRLAKCEKPLELNSAKLTAIVPARCLDEFGKIIDESDAPIKVSIQKNYMMLDLEHIKIITRLVEGDYFDYNKIIPKEFNTNIAIKRAEIEEALDRALLLARSDKTNMVKFDIREGMIVISTNSNMGNLNERINVKMKGKDLKVAFNARYFTEILRTLNEDTISIKFTDHLSPCVINSMSGQEYMYLIIPVRVQGEV